MQPSAREISTCPTCGGPLEKTPDGGLGCMSCLLRAGIGGEEELAQDSTHETLEGDGHFGAYQIDRHEDGSLYELGRGAMGVTYRATDTTLQRKVALKIIKIEVAKRSLEARERFMREARAAAALRHENIATIHQFGIQEETGQYFYAMELIEGETLDERVRRAGPLDARTTIHIGQQVTAALAAAEERGLVHRDLKPANLMLVSPGRKTANTDRKDEKPLVKIIDFGLAKALNTETDPQSLTHDRFIGTPAFASPEQFEHSALDVRSDIYSLGETLWFALTGKTPFAGHSVEEIHRAQQSNVLPIEHLKAAHVPLRLRSLLESMLALEPASRPGTHELAARLRSCSPEARTARRTRLTLAAAGLLILGASAAIIFLSVRTQNSISNLGAPDKSIAVLPFENMSRDPDNAYFAEGIQEEILTRLAGIADLKVISRSSTQQYQSKARNLHEIAKQLGVATILEGSVQKAGAQVRVNVQLVNAQSDSHLWADTYDRNLTDIFGVESEIAKRIADSLEVKLTRREEQALAVKPTNNPGAYDAYLRGVAFQARFSSSFYHSDLGNKAASSFERAVQLDPNFSLAWARLSRMDALLYFNRNDTATVARSEAAKRALENAQKLEPNSPETLLALGYYQFWVLQDYRPAKTTFSRVGKLLPGSSEVPYALGRVSQYEGHLDQSVAYYEQALALDPRNVEVLNDTAWTYAMLRQFPAALKLYDRVLDITPNDPNMMAAKAGIFQAQGNLQEAASSLPEINWPLFPWHTFVTKMTQLRLERNYGELIRLLQTRLAQFHFDLEIDRATDQAVLALTQHLAGDTVGAKVTAEQARNTLERLHRDQPDSIPVAKILSQACAAMGEKDLALNGAERAVMLVPLARDPMLVPILEENVAVIQTIFGENSGAISTLTRLLQMPYDSQMYPFSLTPALLRLDPLWDPLRSDPAFQKLCEDKQPLLSEPTRIPEKSIAVLPFENLSDEKANAYFAEGIQDEILTRLSKIADLKVISRTSTQHYKSAPENLPEIARQLGVAHILEGRVQKSGDAVRVNVQLIKAANDSHLWADTFDRKLTDIFSVESEVAKAIADTLKAKLTGAEEQLIAARPTSDLTAYELYLKGRVLWGKRGGDNIRQAIAFYEQAIVRDRNYAPAYAGLAGAYVILPIYTDASAREAYAKGKAAALKALQLDDKLAEAHNALALVLFLYLDFAGSISEFQRAIALNPNYATAHHWYGFNPLSTLGRFDESIAEGKRAVELDPLSLVINTDLGSILMVARRYDEAIAQLRKTLEMDPTFSLAHGALGEALQFKGDLLGAIAEYTKAQELGADPRSRVLMAAAKAQLGDKDAAVRMLAELEEASRNREIPGAQRAVLYLSLGNRAEAIRCLEQSVADHDSQDVAWIKVYPRWDPLRGDPRFEALVQKVVGPGK